MRVFVCLCLGLLGAGLSEAADLSPYVGNFRLAPDHVVSVADWEVDPSSPHVLVCTDFRTGRIGVLRPASEHQWVLPAALMSGDEEARLRYTPGTGGAAALTWLSSGQAARAAERIPIRSRELGFRSGSATLQGTLWLPAGKGPFPGVVIVPAGRVGRAAAAPFTHFFLSEGYAVLAYDRRAERAAFPQYAADASAAVHALREQPEVHAKRVGLWGHSQGGWVALMAAARSNEIAFVIDHSGMLVPAWQQELYRLAAEALADSTPPETVQQAVAFETLLMRVGASGAGWSEVSAQLAIQPKPAWHALVYQPDSLAQLRRIWRDDFSFDPRPEVKHVRQPVLALFGGLDRSTPIESAAHLVPAIGPEGNLQVEFFPTADHAFLEACTGGNAEIPGLRRFAPGMFDSLRVWLRRHAR
jgi:dienelactone hydrolase